MNGVERMENSLSVQGMRWLHLARMGEPIEAADYGPHLPRFAADVTVHREFERGIGVHHLKLAWPAREMITLDGQGAGGMTGQRALLWKVEKGQGLRDAAVYAGLAHVELTSRWPGRVLVQKKPEGATGEIEIYRDADEAHLAKLEEAGWVPRGFLILV